MQDFDHNSHRHHATEDDLPYKIQSHKSNHIAAHKGMTLTKIWHYIGKRT